MILSGQLGRQLRGAFAGPAQRRFRITAGGGFDQRHQRGHQRRIAGGDGERDKDSLAGVGVRDACEDGCLVLVLDDDGGGFRVRGRPVGDTHDHLIGAGVPETWRPGEFSRGRVKGGAGGKGAHGEREQVIVEVGGRDAEGEEAALGSHLGPD